MQGSNLGSQNQKDQNTFSRKKKAEGTEHGNVVQNMGIPKFQGILGWTLA
jgi:hypothetical protein